MKMILIEHNSIEGSNNIVHAASSEHVAPSRSSTIDALFQNKIKIKIK